MQSAAPQPPATATDRKKCVMFQGGVVNWMKALVRSIGRMCQYCKQVLGSSVLDPEQVEAVQRMVNDRN